MGIQAMIDRSPLGLRIVVMAAGFSTRLGQPKALARIHGISLLRRTIRVLEPLAAEPILIVTPPRATRMQVELRGLSVRLLANSNRAQGLSSSVKLALRASRFSSALLIFPADLPDLNVRDVKRLISRWRVFRRSIVARCVDGRASTPLILPACLFRSSNALTGDVGLRDLVARISEVQRVLVDFPSASKDIDTPDDLAAARRRAPRVL
jgi:molybdenum cofactor cytidylyltransferase